MSKFERWLWAGDFVISGIGWILGGPYAGVLCFAIAGLIIFFAVTKKEDSGNKHRILIDERIPYVRGIKLWHKWGLALSIFCVIGLIAYGVAQRLKKSPSVVSTAIGPLPLRPKGVVIGTAVDSSVSGVHMPADAESAVEIKNKAERTDIYDVTVGDHPQAVAVEKPPSEQEIKEQKWPFAGDHPKVANFFTAHFSEASSLNGVDRFFLYQLMKRGGETPDKQFLLDVLNLDHQVFPSFHGALDLESLHRLEESGFVEKGFPMTKVIKLAEPYRSRFKDMDIPR